MTVLARANLALLALLVLHDLDHLLHQPERTLAVAVISLGLVGLVSNTSSTVLAVRRHALAGWASLIVGFGTAVGFVLVHAVPYWSAFSDPYTAFGADVVSWVPLIITIAMSALVGLLGWREVSSRTREAHA